MGLVSYKVRLVLFCFLCHGTQSSCVLHGLAHGSVGQLQGQACFVFFVVLLCLSWLDSWVCGSTTRWGGSVVFSHFLSCFVLPGLTQGPMGQQQGQAYFWFSASWGTVFLHPPWSALCFESTGQLQSGACFVSFVLSTGQLQSGACFVSFVLSTGQLQSGACFVSFVLSTGQLQSGACFVSFVLSTGQLQSGACFVSFVLSTGQLQSGACFVSFVLSTGQLQSGACFVSFLLFPSSSCVHRGLAHRSVGRLQALFLLCSRAVEFSPFWLPSQSVLPCIYNCIKTHLYKQYHNKWFQMPTTPMHAHYMPTTPSKNTPQTLDVSLFLRSTSRQCECQLSVSSRRAG